MIRPIFHLSLSSVNWKLFLLFCLNFNGLQAQAELPVRNNAQIYQQLILDFHTRHPGPYKAIEGRFFRDYLPNITVDSSLEESLRFEGFSIQYNLLSKKTYLRSIEIPVSLQGSSLQQEILAYQDTLDAKQVRYVIKHSPEPFKGEDPTPYSRWAQPALLIGASILAIVGLFFIRSG